MRIVRVRKWKGGAWKGSIKLSPLCFQKMYWLVADVCESNPTDNVEKRSCATLPKKRYQGSIATHPNLSVALSACPGVPQLILV